MAVNAALYYSDFRGEKVRYIVKLQQYLPADWALTIIYRYKWKFVDDEDMKRAKHFFLYDSFQDLDEEDIREAEKLLTLPFSTVRLMSKVASIRYPQDADNLPDDKYLANCALAWHDFFQKTKTDVYLAGLIDETPGVVGLEVAKKMGLKIIMLHGGKFSHSLYACGGNFEYIFSKKLSPLQIEEFWKLAGEELGGKKVINPQMINIAKRDRNLVNPASIFHLAKAAWRNFNIYHFQTPKEDQKLWYSTLELVVRQVNYFVRSSLSSRYFKEKPKEGEKFVLFPLHYNDDASITTKFPLSTQFEVIEKISKVLPHDIWLYVKPHPHWRSSDVPLGTMQRMGKLPKVRLLSYGTGTKDLIAKAEFTAIINSSLGLECLAAGKRVVAFGVDYPPEIIPRVKDATELIHAAYNRQGNPGEIRNFVAHLRANSIFLCNESFYEKADIDEDADVKSIVWHFTEGYKSLSAK